jgi:hypothetical protein
VHHGMAQIDQRFLAHGSLRVYRSMKRRGEFSILPS